MKVSSKEQLKKLVNDTPLKYFEIISYMEINSRGLLKVLSEIKTRYKKNFHIIIIQEG